MSAPDPCVDDCIGRMSSDDKLTRDRALDQLRCFLAPAASDHNDIVPSAVFDAVRALGDDSWQCRHAQLVAMTALVDAAHLSLPADCRSWLQPFALERLRDAEPRVCVASRDALVALLRRGTAAVAQVAAELAAMLLDIAAALRTAPDSTHGRASPLPSPSVEDANARHHCDCCMSAAQACAECDPAAFAHVVDQRLVRFTLDVCSGSDGGICGLNWFLRKTSFSLLTAMFPCRVAVLHDEPLATDLLEIINSALVDPMPQIRAASSLAARSLLEYSPAEKHAENLDRLLPALCFSRYAATSADLANVFQETWRVVSNDQGLNLVVAQLPRLVDFYNRHLKSELPELRENACVSMNELLRKVPPEKLKSHQATIVDDLKSASGDPTSWRVRCAAISALSVVAVDANCGAEILNRFNVCGNKQVNDCSLIDVFVRCLSDETNQVRAAAAEFLAHTALLHQGAPSDKVVSIVEQYLLELPFQPGSRSDSDVSDEAFRWRRAHGAVLLTLEALTHKPCPRPLCDELLSSDQPQPGRPAASCTKPGPMVLALRLCVKFDRPECAVLLTTVCERLYAAVTSVGKMRFKPLLQDIITCVMHGCTLDGPERTVQAAKNCLQQMATVFGTEIIRGRVEMLDNNEFSKLYDEMVPKGNDN